MSGERQTNHDRKITTDCNMSHELKEVKSDLVCLVTQSWCFAKINQQVFTESTIFHPTWTGISTWVEMAV